MTPQIMQQERAYIPPPGVRRRQPGRMMAPPPQQQPSNMMDDGRRYAAATFPGQPPPQQQIAQKQYDGGVAPPPIQFSNDRYPAEQQRQYAPANFPGQPPMQRMMAPAPGSDGADPGGGGSLGGDPLPAEGGDPGGSTNGTVPGDTPGTPAPGAPGGRPAYNVTAPPTSRRDPVDMSMDDRNYFNQQGPYLDRAAEFRAGQAGAQRNGYRSKMDAAYDPLLRGEGGYRPDEAAEIRGTPDGHSATQQDLDSNQLTVDEQQQIKGRPWDRTAYFDPDSEMARQYESSDKQRGAEDSMERGMYAGITSDLGVNDDYSQDMRGSIANTTSKIRGAVDPTRLRASETALNDIKMSPEEQQRMVTGAGLTVGSQFRNQSEDVGRRAMAAGMSPMGVAGVQARNTKNAAVGEANAMTQAKIAAGAAKASRATTAEGVRMAGETSAADRVKDAETTAGNFDFSARSGIEDRRSAAARDVSDRRIGVAQTAGQTRVAVERDAGAKETQSRQFNTGVGTDLATSIERETSARAKDVAGNRQTINQANQGTKFAQGMTVDATKSGRGVKIADTRRADTAEARGYGREQIAGTQAQEQADYSRQYGNFGTTANALNGSRPADTRTSTTDKILAAGGTAAGAYLGSRDYGGYGGASTPGSSTPPFSGSMNLYPGTWADPAYSPTWGQWN